MERRNQGETKPHYRGMEVERRQTLDFERPNRTLPLIDHKKDPKVIYTTSAPVQKKSIVQNKIVDELGIPLPGVHIINKTTNQALTATDIDGIYKVSINSTDVVEFSHLGYKKTSYPVKLIPPVIKLLPKSNLLNEVVVNANPKKKSSLFGIFSGAAIVLGLFALLSKEEDEPKKVTL